MLLLIGVTGRWRGRVGVTGDERAERMIVKFPLTLQRCFALIQI